jgi:hydrogenase expression/formation protein HypC
VLSVDGVDPAFRTANVDFCGIKKTINLAYTPEVETGDFVLAHVGFALRKIDQEEALRTYGYLVEIGRLECSIPSPMSIPHSAVKATRGAS